MSTQTSDRGAQPGLLRRHERRSLANRAHAIALIEGMVETNGMLKEKKINRAFWFLFKQIHICITHCKRFRFRSPQHLQEKRYHSMSSRTATNKCEHDTRDVTRRGFRKSSSCPSGFVEQFFLRVVQVVSYNALNPGTARSPPSIQAFHVLSLHGVVRNRVGA